MARLLAKTLGGVLAAALLRSAGSAAAAEPERPPPVSSVDAAQAGDDAAAYRGRINHPTAGDTLAWVPRTLFFPFYVVTEFGLRRPIYALSGWVDRAHVVPILNRGFNPTPDIHWFPSFSMDLSRYFAVGGRVRFQNLGVKGHVLDVLTLFGVPSWWDMRLRDTWTRGPAYFGTSAEGLTRADRAFFGFGPETPSADETHFRETQMDAFVFAGVQAPHVGVEARQGFRVTRTGPGSTPSIETRFDTSTIPGFGEIRLLTGALDLRLDTRRRPEQEPRLSLFGNVTYGQDVSDPQRAYVRGSLDLRASAEVSRPHRVLTARAFAADSVALGSEAVPFTEQPMLGFYDLMGFTWGRYRGDTAVLFELSYRYPVAYYTDLDLVATAGNTFLRDFSGFDVAKLAGSLAVGIRTRETGLVPITLLFALGTSRFDEAFSVTSTRLVLQTEDGL